MNQLILIRGLPGAGKSTLADILFRNELDKGGNVVSLSADDYMLDAQGNYSYDRSKLKECHSLCYEDTCFFLLKDYTVIVHNTFTEIWEMTKYRLFALENKIPLSLIHIQGPWKNIHGAPQEKIDEMKTRWENVWIM